MISSKWFSVDQPKTDAEREQRRIQIENAYGVLRLLDQILEHEIAHLERAMNDAFEKPNFAENVARIHGSIKTLKELRTLTPKPRKD